MGAEALLAVLLSALALAASAVGCRRALGRSLGAARWEPAALAAVLACALALRAAGPHAFRYRVIYDDWTNLEGGRSLLVSRTTDLCLDGRWPACSRTERSPVPPAFHALVAASFMLGGVEALSAQLGTLAANLLSIAALWALVRIESREPLAALLAAALLAVHPLHVLYATTVTFGSAAALLSTASLLSLSLVRRGGGAPAAVALVSSLVLMPLSSPMALLALPAAFAGLLSPRWTRLLFAALFLAALSAFEAISILPPNAASRMDLAEEHLPKHLAAAARALGEGSQHSALLLPLALVGLAAAARRLPRPWPLVMLAWLACTTLPLGPLGELYAGPHELDRHLILAAAPLAALAALGLASLASLAPARWGAALAALAVAAAGWQDLALVREHGASAPGDFPVSHAEEARRALPPGCLVASFRPDVAHFLWDRPAVHAGFLDRVKAHVASGGCVAFDRIPECDRTQMAAACDYISREFHGEPLLAVTTPQGEMQRLVRLRPRERTADEEMAAGLGFSVRGIDVVERGCGPGGRPPTVEGREGAVVATASLDVGSDCYTAAAVVSMSGGVLAVELVPEREPVCRGSCAAHLTAAVEVGVGPEVRRVRVLAGGEVLAEAELGWG